MQNVNNVVEIMAHKIMTAIDEKIKALPYDKTFPAVIWGKENDKYQISYENQLRTISSSLEVDIAVGSFVWVKIPCGKLREMHICGIRRK